MHADDPRVFVPFEVEYESMRTPMWVRVTVTDATTTELCFVAEVLVGNGPKGLFAERVESNSSLVTLNVNSANFQTERAFRFEAYVPERVMKPNEPIPPNVVGVRFAEVREPLRRRLLRRFTT